MVLVKLVMIPWKHGNGKKKKYIYCNLYLSLNSFSLYVRLFIIEGAPSVILAAFSAWYLPNKPETAKFLTNEEREFAAKRLENGNFFFF